MRVVVAGAAGLIGRALVERLAADDRVSEVVAVDHHQILGRASKVRGVRLDIGDPSLGRELTGADALVHLAFRDHDPRTSVAAALDASRRLFDAALGAGIRSIVYGSSSAIYGSAADNRVPLREHDPLRAAPFAYPQTKLAVERLLDRLADRAPELRIVRLRPSWVVGPGARMLFAGRVFVSLADYDPLVQATSIEDAVSGFALALHAPGATGAFNLGAPGPVRASEIASLLGVRSIRLPYRARRALAAVMTGLRVPGALHPGFVDMDRFPIVLDSTRARAELGWEPRHSTREALALTRLP